MRTVNYTEVKQEYSDRLGKLMDDCGIFWAFSNEQFAAGKLKHPIAPGEKYTSIGAGGYMPSANVDKYIAGTKELDKWNKQAMKAVKAEQAILYELNNHECFYSCDLTDALEALEPMGYTEEQVRKVYKHNQTLAGSIEKANE